MNDTQAIVLNTSSVAQMNITVNAHEKPLTGYNYLAYIGTNFELVNGVKAKIFFCCEHFSTQSKNEWDKSSFFSQACMVTGPSLRSIHFETYPGYILLKAMATPAGHILKGLMWPPFILLDNLGAYLNDYLRGLLDKLAEQLRTTRPAVQVIPQYTQAREFGGQAFGSCR